MNVLNSLLEFIGNRIDILSSEHLVNSSLTIESGASSYNNYTIRKDGYYPLAITGIRLLNGSGSGGSYGLPSTFSITNATNGSATVNVITRAVGGKVNGCSLYVSILWRKWGGTA